MNEQKIALVTGANKGIGFETCRQLGRLGTHIILTARNQERGRSAVDKLKREGLNIDFCPLDVTSSEAIQQTKRYVEERFNRLDILVNNAGMAHKDEPLAAASVESVSPAVLRQTFDVNFFGLVELTQALLPLIKKSPAGRIVNVSSMLGSLTLHSEPGGGLADFKPFSYDVSKTAVNQFTVHLAAALYDTGIKVNSAHPGWVKTDLGGDEAPMEVTDGARTSVYLATLGEDGPTGKFFHMEEEMPW